jgi:hypothetical protein
MTPSAESSFAPVLTYQVTEMSKKEPCKGILQRVFAAFGSRYEPEPPASVDQMRKTVNEMPAWMEIRDLNRVCEESAVHLDRQQKRSPLRGRFESGANSQRQPPRN